MTFRKSGDQILPVQLDELGDPVLTRAYNRFRVEGHGRRTIEVDGQRFITAATPIQADADHEWSTLIVVPEKDFVGFVALNNRSTLLMSAGVVVLAALFAALLIHQGLRADRNASLVVAREQAREAQSRAFTELASNAAVFDPTREDAIRSLTHIVARAVSARRAATWRVAADSNSILLEDCRDRENDGHTAGVEFARTEMPHFFAALEAGEELESVDAAKDPRMAEFYRLYLKPMGSRALIAIPIRSGERWVGVVCVEDWRADGARSFVRAVANMLAVRYAARLVSVAAAAVPEMAAARSAGGEQPRRVAVAAVSPASATAMRRAQLGEAQRRKLAAQASPAAGDGATQGAQVFPRVSVLVLQLTDPMTMAEEDAEEERTTIVDRIARAVEAIAAAQDIEYVKIMGDKLVLADGFSDASEADSALAIAEAALQIQDHAARLFTALGHRLEFRIGVDTGAAIGTPVGTQQLTYNLWGESMRLADRMAESGLPGSIVVTDTTYRLLRDRYLFRVRGTFYLGGSGEMSTYLLTGRV